MFRADSITTDLIANMQGDKAALLAEVQARMVADPEVAKGIGLEPIDPTHPDGDPFAMETASCPFSKGQAALPKGRGALNAGCPMGH